MIPTAQHKISFTSSSPPNIQLGLLDEAIDAIFKLGTLHIQHLGPRFVNPSDDGLCGFWNASSRGIVYIILKACSKTTKATIWSSPIVKKTFLYKHFPNMYIYIYMGFLMIKLPNINSSICFVSALAARLRSQTSNQFWWPRRRRSHWPAESSGRKWPKTHQKSSKIARETMIVRCLWESH